MVDIRLLAAILRALPDAARLIMIGDADKLAAVNEIKVVLGWLRTKSLELRTKKGRIYPPLTFSV